MCVCVCVCEHTSLLCPASHPEETPPHASGPSLHITGQLCIDSQARQPVVGLGVGEGTQTPPLPPSKNWPDPESPSRGWPSHSPIWILLGKLAPTTAPRKPVQKKAKMCCIFLFALAKKKPRSNHRFGVSPLPFIPLSSSACSFPPAVPSFLACFLPAFCEVCLFPLESERLNCSVNTN